MQTRTLRRFALVVTVALIVSVSTAFAQGLPAPAQPTVIQQLGENVQLVGQIGGASYAVAVQGNHAYVGVGPRVIVLDISTPDSLTVVGRRV